MRYAIALMILAATVTAQGATRRSVVAVADGHDSYSIEVDRNSNGTRPSGVLWFGVTVPRAYVEVVSMQIVDEVTGEVETATNSVPVPHSLCKWSEGDDAPTARSEAEIAAYDAYAAAQAQAAAQAVMQANAAAFLSDQYNWDETSNFVTRVSGTFPEIGIAIATNGKIAFTDARTIMESKIMSTATDMTLPLDARLELSRQVANDSRVCEGIYANLFIPANMTGYQLGVMMAVFQVTPRPTE